jgi:hypothetical protein
MIEMTSIKLSQWVQQKTNAQATATLLMANNRQANAASARVSSLTVAEAAI